LDFLSPILHEWTGTVYGFEPKGAQASIIRL
jgi:hypothetical protein